VHETPGDLARLQQLLDDSYDGAGAHLRSIHTEPRRFDAAAVAGRLSGMRMLVVATVTAHGRPLTGPVDGVFYRGAFHFGTDPSSLRWRHLAANPAVSATHLPSEDWAVVVHGTAVRVDPGPEGDQVLALAARALLEPGRPLPGAGAVAAGLGGLRTGPPPHRGEPNGAGPPPSEDRLFVHTDVAAWKVAYEQSICAYYVGELPRGRAVTRYLLGRPDLPDDIRASVTANRRFYEG